MPGKLPSKPDTRYAKQQGRWRWEFVSGFTICAGIAAILIAETAYFSGSTTRLAGPATAEQPPMARLPAPTPPVVPPPTPPTPAKLPTPLAGRDDADTPNPWDVSGEAALAHHNCAGPDSRHLGCVRFSQKDAIDIVQRNILQDRLPVLRAWIPTGPLTHIEVLATKWERSRYEVCVIINCRDDRLWRFEVDHCSGDIVDIYYIKTLTRDQITASVQQYLDSRSDPQDRDHFLTPKGSTKISPPSWDDHLDRWRVNVQLPRYSGGLFMQIDTSGKIWEVLHVIS